jgi:integrase
MPRRPVRLPQYCCEYKDDKNKDIVRVYFRRPGQPKVRLHGMVGTTAFMDAYEAAKAAYEAVFRAPVSRVPLIGKGKQGTWQWLCIAYMDSAEFKQLRGTTPETRRRIIESTWSELISPESKLTFGDMPIAKMTPVAVRVLRDRKAEFKTAANDRRKVMGYIFRWGMEAHPGLVQSNPTRDVARLKHRVTNVPPWGMNHFTQFMDKYPAGSKERRAMALHLYTGARGCDVRCFGPQHIKNGRFAFVQQKTDGAVDLPLLDELATELALAPKDSLAFILTKWGKTFSQKGYGNWFNDKCRDAGLADRTAHGIRGGAATIAVNNGATVHQLMAMFGWLSEPMAIRYTKQADRKRLADTGMKLVKLERNAC